MRFHETPPLPEILKPKILCKDIAAEPRFWVDRQGGIIPRHSVYYLIPRVPEHLDALLEYLNGQKATEWLRMNSQRAANNFLRLQSTILKQIPVPPDLAVSMNVQADALVAADWGLNPDGMLTIPRVHPGWRAASA